MRLRSTLFDIAAIATTAIASPGCGSQVSGSPSNVDAAVGDSGQAADADAEAGEAIDAPFDVVLEAGENGACDPTFSTSVTPDSACALMEQDLPFDSAPPGEVYGAACESYCDNLCPGADLADSTYWRCQPAQNYFDAFNSSQPDASGSSDAFDAAADAGPVCPPWSGQVVIQCHAPPIGRRTQSAMGQAPCAVDAAATVGAELAKRAHLEDVSVYAFATLERELAAYNAPSWLRRDVRKARRDEIRHTAMMTRLARRFGGVPRAFEAPSPSSVRALFAIALENAIEGCVRETYGAVVALVEARMSRDPQVRRAMRSIAVDECRHAELAWAVAAWVGPRLTAPERESVERGAWDAIAALGRDGDAWILRSLVKRVWSRQVWMAA